jgi:subtilisin family serine protease
MTIMTRNLFWLKSLSLLGSLVLSLLMLFDNPVLAGQGKSKWVSGELLVQYRAGADKKAMDKEFKQLGVSLEKEIDRIKVKRIKVSEANREKVKARLAKNPHVEFVEENFIAQGMLVPSDSSYPSQWHLPKIAAPQSWDVITGDLDFPIAIIDSGIDADHSDLAGKLMTGHNFLTGTTLTDDTYGHGTAVAGSAGAIGNNALGVAGVAWNNPLMPLLVLDPNNSAAYSDIASAIIYAADHGVKVINISLAGSSSSYTMQNAINYAWGKGLVIVASAGNYNVSTLYYPAACDNVVSVSATTSTDTKASFSNFGSWIDLAAPGSGIYTTSKGGVYGSWSGTSFSSPIVAGLAGLIWAANPALTNAEVVDIMKEGADDLGTTGFDTSFGFGRINAYNSVTLAKNLLTNPDLTAPEVAVVSPSDGGTVSNTTVVSVSASDNLAVTRVELLIDGTVFSTDTTAPYSFAWDTTGVADEWLTLSAIAYDEAGNVGQSDVIMVQVSNSPESPAPTDTEAPTATILSPSDGATISGATVVSVSASDNLAVTRVELLIDGTVFSADTTAPYSFTWNTMGLADGWRTLSAVAYDEAGNVGRSDETMVLISNPATDTVAPTVTIVSPYSGSAVAKKISINVQASDNVGVNRIELYIDGKLKRTSYSGTLAFVLNTSPLRSGAHTLLARAFDAAGNVSEDSVVVYR